jgi:hypothetical protein
VDNEEQLDRMRKAVKAFRKMQPTLSAYAKALTGNSKVRVVLSSASAMTDGTNIFFRPPLALGDTLVHDKRNCDKRDPETYVQLCHACAVREEVYVNIFHEIGHIAFDSFGSVSDHSKEVALMQAASEMGDKYAEALAASFKKNAPTGYMALSNFINPYFNGLFNAIEDARVDAKMFKARPGIRVMLQASTLLIFKEGTDPYSKGSESNQNWMDAPLNAQAAIACIMRLDRYRGWEPYLNPDVVRHTGMPNVQAVLDQLAVAETVEDTFRLALPLMEALREYGYFKKPEEIPPPPPPPSSAPSSSSDESDDDEGGDDSSEGEGAGSGDPGSPSESQQEQGSGDDVPDASDSERPADNGSDDSDDASSGGEPEDGGSSSGSQNDDDESAGGEGSSSDGEANDEGSSEVGGDDSESGADSDPGADSPDADGSGGSDQQEETEGSEGDGDSGLPSHEGAGPDAGEPGSSGGDGGEPGDDADSEGDSSSGGVGSDQDESDPGETGDHSGSDGPGAGDSSGGTSESESGEQAGDDDTDSSDGSDSADEAGGEPDGDDSSEGGSDEDAGASDEDSADSSGLPSDDRSDEGGPDDGASDSGDVPDVPGMEEEVPGDVRDSSDGSDDRGSDSPTETQPPPPDHKHGTDGRPCECGHCRTYGQPDDLKELVHSLHEQVAKLEQADEEVDPFGGADTDRDFTVFIDQSEHMDTPSTHIEKVMIHTRGNPNSTHFFNKHPDENVMPESVVGGALLHARKTFADNMRAAQETNLRRGRIRTSTLGRRAWQGDPRLFQRSRQPGRKDYSVLIGIDLSSSSRGSAHEMIRKAALAQAEICHRLGLRFAVYGHSGNRYTERQGYAKPDLTYEALDIIVIKEFDAPWNDEAKSRMMSVRAHGANLDGHTLEYYRKRLDEEATTDRILMYYTDGYMPWANKEEELEVLTREIKTCQRKGYTLMGVEVGTSAHCPPELDTVGLVDESDVKAVVKHLAKRLEQR